MMDQKCHLAKLPFTHLKRGCDLDHVLRQVPPPGARQLGRAPRLDLAHPHAVPHRHEQVELVRPADPRGGGVLLSFYAWRFHLDERNDLLLYHVVDPDTLFSEKKS